MPHAPRGLVAGRVCLLLEVELPDALGALDGKHIPIRCPQGGGSLYHNYKGFHSIVLLVQVEGGYKFPWVDVGAAGSTSDAHIFKHTNLRHKIEDRSIGFPDSKSLWDSQGTTLSPSSSGY